MKQADAVPASDIQEGACRRPWASKAVAQQIEKGVLPRNIAHVTERVPGHGLGHQGLAVDGLQRDIAMSTGMGVLRG